MFGSKKKKKIGRKSLACFVSSCKKTFCLSFEFMHLCGRVSFALHICLWLISCTYVHVCVTQFPTVQKLFLEFRIIFLNALCM
jgi:hypothetical protein